MSQAKQQYETLQKKMEQTVIEATSGGGSVTVKMDGRKQALNEAGRKVDQAMQSNVSGMLGGLGGIL